MRKYSSFSGNSYKKSDTVLTSEKTPEKPEVRESVCVVGFLTMNLRNALVHLGCSHKNIICWTAYEQQKFISHSSGS
jgi:hypothetical protein